MLGATLPQAAVVRPRIKLPMYPVTALAGD